MGIPKGIVKILETLDKVAQEAEQGSKVISKNGKKAEKLVSVSPTGRFRFGNGKFANGEQVGKEFYTGRPRISKMQQEEVLVSQKPVPNSQLGVRPKKNIPNINGVKYGSPEALAAEKAAQESDRLSAVASAEQRAPSGLTEKAQRLRELKRKGLTGRVTDFVSRHKFATGAAAGLGLSALYGSTPSNDMLPAGFQKDPESGYIFAPDGAVYDPNGQYVGNINDNINQESAPENESTQYNGFGSLEEEMSAVAQVQKHLNDQGFSLKIDGMWGPRTQAAWEASQRGVQLRKATHTASVASTKEENNTNPYGDKYKVMPMITI